MAKSRRARPPPRAGAAATGCAQTGAGRGRRGATSVGVVARPRSAPEWASAPSRAVAAVSAPARPARAPRPPPAARSGGRPRWASRTARPISRAEPYRSRGSSASAIGDRLGELGGDGGDERVEHRGFLALLLERELGERGGLVGQAPGDQLVGDDAERVQVRGGPGVLAARLLGREVRGGAEHRADLCDARLLGGLRDAEVGELHLALARAQQVAGLDVAVHDAVAVRVVQPLAGLLDDRHALGRPRPTPRRVGSPRTNGPRCTPSR